jgi:hypothetical protein
MGILFAASVAITTVLILAHFYLLISVLWRGWFVFLAMWKALPPETAKLLLLAVGYHFASDFSDWLERLLMKLSYGQLAAETTGMFVRYIPSVWILVAVRRMLTERAATTGDSSPDASTQTGTGSPQGL